VANGRIEMRRGLLAVTALVAATVVALSATPAWGSHSRTAGSSERASDVLVFLRGPVAVRAASRAHASELARQDAVAHSIATLGATVLARSTVPDVLFVRATAAESHELAAESAVGAVLPNTQVPGPSLPTELPSRSATVRHGARDAGPCGTAAHPESDPEALANIHGTPADTDGYDGAGVTVAILGDGLSPSNPDLLRNAAYASTASPAGSRVVTDYEDFTGDGPTSDTFGSEAFGDASSIAAQGNGVYDLSQYAQALERFSVPNGCDIKITGDAPGSSLIALKLFGYSNVAYAEQTVQAINYAVTHGANVLSESFGFNNFPDTSEDAIRLADSAAVAAGVTVVVSSGDAGPNSTISSPASDPDVLAVGATTTYRAYEQLTYGGINALGRGNRYVDDNISSLSSGGVAFDGKTVNLVAPGDLNWALCSASGHFIGCGGEPIELFGGTSESAPLSAGAAADVIQAYEATHNGAVPTPDVVMRILTSTASDVGAPADQQGAGLLQVGAAVQLATSLPGTTSSSSQGGVIASTTQLELAGLPGSSQTSVLGFTDASSAPVQLDVATRALVPVARRFGVTHFGRHDRAPRFTDGGGALMVMRRFPIRVTSQTARVQFQTAFSQDFFEETEVSLFDPKGRLAAYSLPQGPGGFADIEAATSGPGVWTAVIFEPLFNVGRLTLPWSITWWQFRQRDECPSLVIEPGQQASCDVDVTMPSSGGDTSLAVVARSATGELTIPVTLRTQLPVSAGSITSFRGIITGGNGRFGAAGQTNTYSFNIPSGEKDLDVAIVLAGRYPNRAQHGDVVEGLLVDPAGTLTARSVNLVRRTASISASPDLQLYAGDPTPGMWQLLLVVQQPVDGTHVQLGFTGTIDFNQISISSSLPDSATATVPSGGATYSVEVRNTGVSPMFVSLDPRTTQAASISPTVEDAQGIFVGFHVPPWTGSISVVQTSTGSSTFELVAPDGSPVITPEGDTPFVTASTSANGASLEYQPPTPLTSGFWEVAPDVVGPFTQPTATNTSDVVSLTTFAFDATVRSNVYDIARIDTAESPQAGFFGRYTPAGTRVRIAVAIRPDATSGTVVQGTLLVEDVDEVTGTLNVLAAIPYEYVAP
jgi:hypothetical protein